MIATAGTNGGRLNTVHNEFLNGYLFAVLLDGDYVPVSFSIEDIYGCMSDTLIASGDLYHKRLMRSDGGWVVEDDSVTPTFDFRELQEVVYGYSKGPDGETDPIYGYSLLEGSDVAICGLTLNSVRRKRCDRNFWEIGNTVQNATGNKDLFGMSQIDPRSCPKECVSCEGGQCSTDTWKSRTGCEETSNDCYVIDLESK